MHKTSIIIVSYNCKYLMQKNIESIRNTLNPGKYSIYVTDNGSTDGVAEWLEEQADVTLIKNSENLGFAPACNQGVKAAWDAGETDADIFLLNNDTRLCPGSLENLSSALHGADDRGAVGAVSNYAGNDQQIELFCQTPGEYVEYGAGHNANPEDLEERVRLSGFAMLIKAEVWKQVGGMDEDFAPGYFEDDDLCMRIAAAGYRMFLCRNSFIYHAGSQAFGRMKNVGSLLKEHHSLFMEKHGFDILKYAKPRYAHLSQIKADPLEPLAILVASAGLGADAKFIRSIYKNAVVFGIESSDALRQIAGKTEAVFENAAALREMVNFRAFDYFITDNSFISSIDKEARNMIADMCKPTCRVIKRGPERGIDFSKIKLVIWDMDDTFWQGTLTEQEVHVSEAMEQLVRDLSAHGIINSISSKNDWQSVAEVLGECSDLGNHFVFNNINWQPKGPQISEKLSLMGLRAENALFIDDNPRNLREAKQYCPELITASPSVITGLSDYVNSTPATDPELTRLAHYNILEEKTAVRMSSYEDPTEFLFDSDIRMAIGEDCAGEKARIAELVNRTNQLNFTKLRQNEEELEKLFEDPGYECGYVRVRDRFGDYGIAGFFALEKETRRLLHFLFSCRCMGMGIEQAVYAHLGYPELTVNPPVSVELEKKEAPWVRQVYAAELDETNTGKESGGIRLLLKGPCDLDSMAGIADYPGAVREFNYINSKGFVTTGQNHSIHVVESETLESTVIEELIKDAPFIIYGDFETELFKKPHDIVIYSLLPDCHSGIYRHRGTGARIAFGSRNFDLTDPANTPGYIDGTIQNHGFKFTEKIIRDFSEKWEFEGATPPEVLIENLQFMYDRAPGEPRFILLLGSTVPFEGENAEFAGHEEFHAQINPLVREFAKDKDRIRLVDPGDYIRSTEDYADCCDHYSRRVYMEMASDIRRLISEDWK